MKVSLKWMREYVNYDGRPEELARRLTMSGSNAESIEYPGRDIKSVVVGEIIKIGKHPDSDKLLVTKVNVGHRVLQIVTGARNIKEGDRVAVALPGAVIEGGIEIKVQSIKGLESQGMLCSAKELGLDDSGLPEDVKNGLLILPEDAPVGNDIKDYIGLEDVVIDFEITPNRPDCLSIVGMAREAAATFNIPLNPLSINLKEESVEKVPDIVNVTVEAGDLCKRYIARIIKDVKIKPSPLWMQRRLQVCGIRPINNIVDITNYVMLELGQPLHAFDYDKLAGCSIIVRRGKKGETITTLDGKLREICEDTLVIADKKGPVALAGIMGGAETEVTSETRTVLLESANFWGPNIRRTSRKMGLRTEASQRFEKGLDPNLAAVAAERACELIERLGAGRVLKGCVDVYPEPVLPRKLPLRVDRINALLGTEISRHQMIDILERLGIKSLEESDQTFVVIPTFRADITQEADLAEEIARIYGYDNLPSTLPGSIATCGKLNRNQKLTNEIKQTLMGCGFSEIYTYSFISPSAFDALRAPEDHEVRRAVKIINPLGEEHSIMRTTLLPGILEVIKLNLNQKRESIRIFELGTVYIPRQIPLKELPVEKKKLGVAICDENLDFYYLKGVIETLLLKLKIRGAVFYPGEHFSLHPGRTATISIDGEIAGFIGEVHPDVMENYGMEDKRAYVAELDLDLLLDRSQTEVKFKPLPRFPAADRDVAIVVEEGVTAGSIMEAIKEAGGEVLENVELFDVYRGNQIPEGYKSLAFSLTYRAKDRTLTDEEINRLHGNITECILKKFNGRLRE
ncbi:phenylalanine--tRNA ligase subunit beta [Thermosediminibacter oceani]|uniref:Phenylalanine--tRNA ligase beta subunit n=1 Tax=Thermosediminibacter oceani (strain ATCC BAA-1034 / DSM 16646 / JW/IW-1228P) TaxID=555079 RepID=D9RXS7_THEOJ|nr:phenylalanine--tRNA ligase subunit beta [Thermosediminibacter oceani]ADL08151.1 phenylalanyl-tRNA synthetase beta subunit [Thermosediminibacter oceani DSM 16646]